tara:strand:- start:339 stop:653 length:315 start_codon:yes stop_codon:yes gene_type:complete
MAVLARDSINEDLIQAASPTGTTQTITTSGSSAATSSGVATSTRVVRIVATEDCHITFATSPTATTSLPFLPAKQVEYFKITGGHKVAAIQSSTAGTVYVTEME